ncbi:MAG: type II toxin-antitoxin system VapC family toxin [Deltaproteobacteria bacterium]|nr:type II toxin-antitoxin system VapC family toxin [Deltaproteobacteria bacterium]
MKALLDTHVLLWHLGGGGRLTPRQRRVLAAASPDAPLHVADITLWEIAMLHHLGRIQLGLPLRDWLDRAVAPPLVVCERLTPAIAAELAALPATFPRDPADRIITATARVLGATLLTSDQRIKDAGVVPTW